MVKKLNIQLSKPQGKLKSPSTLKSEGKLKSPSTSKSEGKLKFLRKKLKNGMIVVMEPRELDVVSFAITNRFGGAYEPSEIKGIAHVMEHMLLSGTKTRSHEEISREIEKKGGVLNAFTSHEVTSYWFKLPSEHLFAGMDIIIDSVKNPKFDKEKFEKEKKVILEEIKMYKDSPREHALWMIEKNLYEKPFGELIIGNAESVSKLDRNFVVDYYKNVYSPENYIVTIVGKGDFEKICKYLEKSFVAEGKKPEMIEIKKKNGESVVERADLDQANFVFGVHGPLPGAEEYYDLEVLDAYLANGMSSKLFLEIREERGLAYAVKSIIEAEKSYCNYLIFVGTMKENVGKVKELILQGFEDIKKMTEKDLEEAKERVLGLKKISGEESANVMNELTFAELCDDVEGYYKYEDKIKAVSLEGVKKLARELVKEYSTAAVLPK